MLKCFSWQQACRCQPGNDRSRHLQFVRIFREIDANDRVLLKDGR